MLSLGKRNVNKLTENNNQKLWLFGQMRLRNKLSMREGGRRGKVKGWKGSVRRREEGECEREGGGEGKREGRRGR